MDDRDEAAARGLAVTRPATSKVTETQMTFEARRQPSSDSVGKDNRQAGVDQSSSANLKTTGLDADSLDGASGNSSESTENARKPATRSHNTRSKNGIQKQRISTSFQEEEVKQPKAQAGIDPITECAHLLSLLDKRSHSKSVIKDANALLEAVLLPMSFPWSHAVDPVLRTIPRDIDEMYAIKNADIEDQSTEFISASSPIRDPMLPSGARAACKRSADPGVIELTTFFNPSVLQRSSAILEKKENLYEDDSHVPGELSYRLYEEVQLRKRQRTEIEEENLKRMYVSIRLGCTSSKRTIFDDDRSDMSPLLLPALLPDEIRDGKRLTESRALAIAANLGTYDRRHGLSPLKHLSGRRRRRLKTGRIHRVWVEKTFVSTQPKGYRSILTGERLESNEYKRPVLVKVGIRLNGKLLSVDQALVGKSAHALASALCGSETEQFSYGTKTVNEAIQSALSNTQDFGDNSQCTLNATQFSVNVSSLMRSGSKIRPVGRFRTIISVKDNIGWNVEIIPPRFDSFATEDGIITVGCSTPGTIAASSFAVPPIAAALSTGRCAICWRKLADQPSSSCKRCRRPVHDSCRLNATINSEAGDEPWSCAMCSCPPQSQSSQQVCIVCNLRGGHLIPAGDKLWVHDICNVWASPRPPSTSPSQSVAPTKMCHLCSVVGPAENILQCAANSCQVCFHPMCAVVYSQVSEIFSQQHPPPLENEMSYDSYLCTQFTLSMVESQWGSVRSTSLIPVGFCGYHNPGRKRDCYGMYAIDGCLEGAVRIPPRR